MAKQKLQIHPKAPKGEDGYRTFSIRIREETVEKLDTLSQESGHSRNQLIATFIDYALENCEIVQK